MANYAMQQQAMHSRRSVQVGGQGLKLQRGFYIRHSSIMHYDLIDIANPHDYF